MAASRLTDDIIKRAEDEIGEKVKWRKGDINAVGDLIKSDDELTGDFDETLLLRFLRATNFDYEAAVLLLKNYYRLKATSSSLFRDVDQLQAIFRDNLVTVLANKSDCGETILVVKLGQLDLHKYTLEDICAACFVSLETCLLEEVTQITGFVVIIDMNSLGWTLFPQFGPHQAKKLLDVVDNCLPVRFKTIHVINETVAADVFLAVLKPFLTEEMSDKIIVHGNNLNVFHKMLPQAILPSDLGGYRPQIDSTEWMEQVRQSQMDMRTVWDKCNVATTESNEGQLSHYDSKSMKVINSCNYVFNFFRPKSQ